MFFEERNYFLFLNLLKKYLLSYIDIYSYSLIPNHFHLFIRVRDGWESSETGINKTITNQFRKLFISYSTTLNKEYTLQGGFFLTPFKRILITNEFYFSQIIFYIHCNAIHHNLCAHPSEYLFSSYNSILSDKPSLLKRDEVLAWFGGKEAFIRGHELMESYYAEMPFFVNDGVPQKG